MQLYSKNYSSDHDEKIEKEFQSMLDDARSTYVIPKAAFDNYRVKKGLREADGPGVTAGVTRIGNAHGYIMNEGEKCAVDGKSAFFCIDLDFGGIASKEIAARRIAGSKAQQAITAKKYSNKSHCGEQQAFQQINTHTIQPVWLYY